MGVHSDIKLSFYFCAFPQHYKESSCLSLLKCSEGKVIFVCYPNIYWCDSQVICLIKVCNLSFILSVSLSSRFPTLHPNSLHSPSLHHTSMHLTGMCRVLTVNHILDPGGAVASSLGYPPSEGALQSCESTCPGSYYRCITTKESVLRKRVGGVSAEPLVAMEEVTWAWRSHVWYLSETGATWVRKVYVFCKIVIQT